jgi:hypothetical protein
MVPWVLWNKWFDEFDDSMITRLQNQPRVLKYHWFWLIPHNILYKLCLYDTYEITGSMTSRVQQYYGFNVRFFLNHCFNNTTRSMKTGSMRYNELYDTKGYMIYCICRYHGFYDKLGFIIKLVLWYNQGKSDLHVRND